MGEFGTLGTFGIFWSFRSFGSLGNLPISLMFLYLASSLAQKDPPPLAPSPEGAGAGSGAGTSVDLYHRVKNISFSQISNFPASLPPQPARDALHCASLCLYDPLCNAFALSSSICSTLALTFMEERQDTDEEWPQVTMAASSLVATHNLICHGGEDCCMEARFGLYQCGLGAGDCNHDSDCSGTLVCGLDNCLTEFPSDPYSGKERISGGAGLWDSGDDCCTRRCRPGHLCVHGEGTCTTNSDCLGGLNYYHDGSQHVCVQNCLERTWYPLADSPNMTETMGFSSTSSCCRRRCVPSDQCGQDVQGCWRDDDCMEGLECKKEDSATVGYCTDMDECTDVRPEANKLAVCGERTDCVNSIGSFSCPCHEGFHNFQEGVGCTDIDECTEYGREGAIYCGANTHCNNTVGSYSCAEHNCHEGHFNWRPLHGCFPLLSGNTWKIVTTPLSEEIEFAVHKGKIGVFLVGGGGGGYTGCCGGWSGRFSYRTWDIPEDQTRFQVQIGAGGSYNREGGTTYAWYLVPDKTSWPQYSAGGGTTSSGWSQGGTGSKSGCKDGRTGKYCWGPRSRNLPNLPYIGVSGAPGGVTYKSSSYGYYDGVYKYVYSNWGGGGGGISVDGSSPSSTYDGHGYGGGGGNYNRGGISGVAVIFTGDGVVAGNDVWD